MIVVSGYYGFGNLGDEAILAVLCRDLEALGVERRQIVVLSADPPRTAALHEVQALPRFNLFRIWRILASARCFISGGGSLLQDATSIRSIPYYLGIVELALLRKVPVVMYGQGLGPVHSTLYKRWIGRAFSRSAAFSVRDQDSARLLKELGVSFKAGQLSADPVFQWERKSREPAESGTLLLNLRPYARWKEQKNFWMRLISDWHKSGLRVRFIPFGPGDDQIGRELGEGLPNLEIHPRPDHTACGELFADARLCVSMRLHGIIFSALHDVLPLAISYDPKVSAVSQQLKVPCWGLSDLKELPAGVQSALNDLDQHRALYRASLQELKEKALANRSMLAQVLCRGWKNEESRNFGN